MDVTSLNYVKKSAFTYAFLHENRRRDSLWFRNIIPKDSRVEKGVRELKLPFNVIGS
jgi:hypothetical protein